RRLSRSCLRRLISRPFRKHTGIWRLGLTPPVVRWHRSCITTALRTRRNCTRATTRGWAAGSKGRFQFRRAHRLAWQSGGMGPCRVPERRWNEARMMEAPATEEKPALKVRLCSPRGFCAGVVRAIDTVEQALARYGAPVYVRHEIVHNRYVVESLKAKGAVFVEELDEIPDTDAPVIFSAHGVPKSIPQ